MIGIVDYQPRLDPSQQAGDLFIGKIQLIEGANQVDIEEWNRISNHPLIQARIDNGVIRPTFASPTIIQPSASESTNKNKKAEKLPVEEFRPAASSNSVETSLNLTSESTLPVIDSSSSIRPAELEKTVEKKK